MKFKCLDDAKKYVFFDVLPKMDGYTVRDIHLTDHYNTDLNDNKYSEFTLISVKVDMDTSEICIRTDAKFKLNIEFEYHHTENELFIYIDELIDVIEPTLYNVYFSIREELKHKMEDVNCDINHSYIVLKELDKKHKKVDEYCSKDTELDEDKTEKNDELNKWYPVVGNKPNEGDIVLLSEHPLDLPLHEDDLAFIRSCIYEGNDLYRTIDCRCDSSEVIDTRNSPYNVWKHV